MLAGCRDGADLVIYDNICQIKGREGGHDPMVFKFSFMPSNGGAQSSGGASASGAAEHAATSAPEIPDHDSWTTTRKAEFVSQVLEPDAESEVEEADYPEADYSDYYVDDEAAG